MATMVVFNKDNTTKVLVDNFHSQKEKPKFVWMHFRVDEDEVMHAVMQELDAEENFQEDLIEDQRPRLTNYPNYSVLVFNLPTTYIYRKSKEDIDMLQLSFVLTKDKLISISSQEHDTIDGFIKLFSNNKKHEGLTPAILLSRLFDEILEYTIAFIEDEEELIDKMEFEIISTGKADIPFIQNMKESHSYGVKVLKANLEVVTEIMHGFCPMVDAEEFPAHIEDRLLYSIDLMDNLREAISSLPSIYMAALSNKMNQSIHKLTILGSLILIPTLIASLYGMNLPLPPLSFWEVVVVSIGMSIGAFMVLKLVKWI